MVSDTLYICDGYPLNGVGTKVGSMEEVKENKKVLYHFAIFAIVNELLIIKNRSTSPTANARRDASALRLWLLGVRGVYYKRQWLLTSSA